MPGEKFQSAQRGRQTAEERVRELEQQNLDQQKTIENLQRQIADQRGFSRQDFEQLVQPVKIQLIAPSGGYDTDGKPGDDGIVLYMQPVDADGHVIKAAGSLKVRLLDLTQPAEKLEMGQYLFDVPTTRSKWYGRLWTNHFTIRCPWAPGRLPSGAQVTAHVEFTDLLTGRVLSAQEVYPVQISTGPSGAASQ